MSGYTMSNPGVPDHGQPGTPYPPMLVSSQSSAMSNSYPRQPPRSPVETFYSAAAASSAASQNPSIQSYTTGPNQYSDEGLFSTTQHGLHHSTMVSSGMPSAASAVSAGSSGAMPYRRRNSSGVVVEDGHPPPPGTHHQRSASGTIYEFVSLPSSAQPKRPRRKYEEIERIYNCNYPGCTEAYGTLNHLNAHVTMQKHGSKRTPDEFRETRRLWKLRKERRPAPDAINGGHHGLVSHPAQIHSQHPHSNMLLPQSPYSNPNRMMMPMQGAPGGVPMHSLPPLPASPLSGQNNPQVAGYFARPPMSSMGQAMPQSSGGGAMPLYSDMSQHGSVQYTSQAHFDQSQY